MKCASGPKAWLVSLSIPITPSDPRIVRTTEMTHAFGKFVGSSKSLPSVFGELWRTLRSFKNICVGPFFVLFCFGNSSPELSIDGLRCLFYWSGIVVAADVADAEVDDWTGVGVTEMA